MKGFSAVFLILELLWVAVTGISAQIDDPNSASFDSLSYNFTLAAVNTTLPNANLTGSPLVLGAGGATGGITFYVTSTHFSFPYNDYPSLGLVNRALRAYDSEGRWNVNVSAVHSGERLVWSRSIIYPNLEDNSRIYSAIDSPSSPYPLLAAYNISTLWSLCPFPGSRGQTQLVFNVSVVKPPPYYIPYDPYLCYDVTVNILST